MTRAIIGTFLALHGVAHAVGFTASWKVAASTEVPYSTEVLNGLADVGDAGIRLIGVLWLVAAAAMVAAAVLVWNRSPGARAGVATATTLSLVMCMFGLPAAQIGAAIDLAILGILAATATQDQPRRRGDLAGRSPVPQAADTTRWMKGGSR